VASTHDSAIRRRDRRFPQSRWLRNHSHKLVRAPTTPAVSQSVRPHPRGGCVRPVPGWSTGCEAPGPL